MIGNPGSGSPPGAYDTTGSGRTFGGLGRTTARGRKVVVPSMTLLVGLVWAAEDRPSKPTEPGMNVVEYLMVEQVSRGVDDTGLSEKDSEPVACLSLAVHFIDVFRTPGGLRYSSLGVHELSPW